VQRCSSVTGGRCLCQGLQGSRKDGGVMHKVIIVDYSVNGECGGCRGR
jgi:hypothetical protein